MSTVRVLVGTRKGAFILTSDEQRSDWQVSGPHFAGWEIYHLKGSPLDPNRIYASQSSGWFGQIDPALGRRRPDLGRRWATTSSTRASPARTSGTTAPSTPGSSSASGSWSRR